MNKFLILEFRNAGLFRKNKYKKSKDKIFDLNDRRERFLEPEFVEPITVHQISNMLHVLFGERPIPSNRKVSYKALSYIYNKALKSYLKIETIKNENGNFPKETIQIKKSVYNAWNTQSFLYWERIKKLLEEPDLINEFVDVLSEVFSCDIETFPFNQVKEMLLKSKDKRLVDLFTLLKGRNKSTIYKAIYGKKEEVGDLNKDKRTMLTVNTATEDIYRLSGQIIVPVSEKDLDKIRAGKGSATLLDDGLVYIKEVVSGNTLQIDGFIKVKNISIAKQ